MTATRGIGRVATLVVLCAAWLAAAAFLWRTSVPTNLDLGGLDVHRFFTAHELQRAADYQRFLDVLWLVHLVATIVALAVLARRAPKLVPTLGLGRIGAGVIVAMLVLVTLWFVSLPFGFLAQWWDIRHGLAPHDYTSWLADAWPTLAFEAVFGLVFVVIVLGLAGRFGDRWWLVGGPLFVVFAALFVFLGGWLAQLGTQRVESTRLRSQIQVLERREGVRGTPVRVQDVTNVTREANAFTSGFGPSANVVLWNTMLQAPFTPGEIRVVVAHELGHVRHRHTLKSIGWVILTVLPIAWLITLVARRRGGIANPETIPLVLLTLVVLNVLTAPLEMAISRRYEAEADWSALKATRDPRSARRLFVDFQRTSLQEPNPSLLDYLWLENHPTIAQRIAMVEAWARRQGVSLGAR